MDNLRKHIRKMLAEMLNQQEKSSNITINDGNGNEYKVGDVLRDSNDDEFIIAAPAGESAVILRGKNGEEEVGKIYLKYYTKVENTNEGQETETAPTPTTTPTTTPSPNKRPLKIPRPGTFPKPNPKAKVQDLDMPSGEIFSMNLNEWAKKIKFEEENARRRRLIREAPMDLEPGKHQPHPSIRSGIEGISETPFTAVDLFSKQVLDKSSLEKLGSEEFKDIVTHLNTIGELNPMEIMNTLNMIMSYESGHKPALENLALTTVRTKFGLPDEIMDMITAKLKGPGEITPPDDDCDAECEVEEAAEEMFTPEELEIIKKHANKRVINNALMMGAGYRAHKIFNDLKTSLDAIDPRLFPLYGKLMGNVELFLWKMPVEEMFGQRQMWGKSEIKVEQQEEEQEQGEEQGEEQEQGEAPKVTAEATAIIFPILLHEVAKSAVEILFLQHLADVQEQHGEKVAAEVVKKADSYMDEHWMKLIGPRLWKYLHDALIYVVQEEGEDHTIISFVLNKMATMSPEEFTALLDDTIHNGPGAIEKIKAIVREVASDIEDFENQNQEAPAPQDIAPGQDMSAAIGREVRQSGLDQDAIERASEPVAEPKKALEDMEIDELNNELGAALEDENYEMASKIRDAIRAKMA